MLREARETADIEIFQSACRNVSGRRVSRESSIASRERFQFYQKIQPKETLKGKVLMV